MLSRSRVLGGYGKEPLVYAFSVDEQAGARVPRRELGRRPRDPRAGVPLEPMWSASDRDQRLFRSSGGRSAVLPRAAEQEWASLMELESAPDDRFPALTGYDLYVIQQVLSRVPAEMPGTPPSAQDLGPVVLRRGTQIELRARELMAASCDELTNSRFVDAYLDTLQRSPSCGTEFLFVSNELWQTLSEKLKHSQDAFREGVLRWAGARLPLAYPRRYRFVVLPFATGTHWFLVVGNLDARCIELYDSLTSAGSRYYRAAALFMRHFMHVLFHAKTRMQEFGQLLDTRQDNYGQPVLSRHGRPMYVWSHGCTPYADVWQKTPQQGGGTECGIYTMLFARYRCRWRPFDFSRADIDYFRKVLLLEVWYDRVPYTSSTAEDLQRRPKLRPSKPPARYVNWYLGAQWYRLEPSRYGGLPAMQSVDNLRELLARYEGETMRPFDASTLDDPLPLLEELSGIVPLDQSNLERALLAMGWSSHWLPFARTKAGYPDTYDLVRIVLVEAFERKDDAQLTADVLAQPDDPAAAVIQRYGSASAFLQAKGWHRADLVWRLVEEQTEPQLARRASRVMSEQSSSGGGLSTADMVRSVYALSVREFIDKYNP